MSPLSLLFFPLRSSSTSRPRDKSSRPIDDNISQCFSNFPILSLLLMKERKDPEHEFIILRTNDDLYRVERRPSEGTKFASKLRGCKAEDIITPLDEDDYERVRGRTDSKIFMYFAGEPKPDLHTVYNICDAIRKDPDTEKYTLPLFNCFFFARTLTLLIARYSFLRQYCVRISPMDDYSSLAGPAIDAIVDRAINGTLSWDCWISISIFFDSDFIASRDYKDLRQCILEMNERHCKTVNKLGGNGKVVYDAMNRKKEEVWGRMHSGPGPTLSERRVDPDLALDSHAMPQSDENVK